MSSKFNLSIKGLIFVIFWVFLFLYNQLLIYKTDCNWFNLYLCNTINKVVKTETEKCDISLDSLLCYQKTTWPYLTPFKVIYKGYNLSNLYAFEIKATFFHWLVGRTVLSILSKIFLYQTFWVISYFQFHTARLFISVSFAEGSITKKATNLDYIHESEQKLLTDLMVSIQETKKFEQLAFLHFQTHFKNNS